MSTATTLALFVGVEHRKLYWTVARGWEVMRYGDWRLAQLVAGGLSVPTDEPQAEAVPMQAVPAAACLVVDVDDEGGVPLGLEHTDTAGVRGMSPRRRSIVWWRPGKSLNNPSMDGCFRG
ncbi:hypothetical protein NKDENANG_00464 [Candidatus Entotheonellaceae bacterium PAL068K]